ncbi:MAG: type II secretion system protein GspN [Desulfobulbus sp.]|jgi:type II secretion system protein N
MQAVFRPFRQRWLGYLAYGLVLAALFLWVLFPREQLRRALSAQLSAWYPALSWRVGAVEPGLPLELRVETVEGLLPGEERVLVRLQRVVLWPDLRASWRNRCLQGGFRLELGQGQCTGSWQRYRTGPVAWIVRSRIEAVDLAGWPLLSRELEREVQGRVEGTCTLAGAAGDGRLDHVAAELRIVQGRIGLQQRLLGYRFFPFTQATVKVFGQGKRWEIVDGVIEGERFTCSFAGALTGGKGSLLEADLDLRGVLQPGTGFFQNGEQAAAVRALRARMGEAGLPFRISGALSRPGVHFGPLGALVRILEEELR